MQCHLKRLTRAAATVRGLEERHPESFRDFLSVHTDIKCVMEGLLDVALETVAVETEADMPLFRGLQYHKEGV
jgi:hypothetical protein